jgi:hypothetical protein
MNELTQPLALALALRAVIAAASKDATRPGLNGVQIRHVDFLVTVTAADGWRAHRVSFDAQTEANWEFLFPVPSVPAKATAVVDCGSLIVTSGNAKSSYLPVNATFPRVDGLVPSKAAGCDGNRATGFNPSLFASVLKSAELLNKSVCIHTGLSAHDPWVVASVSGEFSELNMMFDGLLMPMRL